MASFFTPVSQKPKEAVQWSERAHDENAVATLLVAKYEPEESPGQTGVKCDKVAAFDMVCAVRVRHFVCNVFFL